MDEAVIDRKILSISNKLQNLKEKFQGENPALITRLEKQKIITKKEVYYVY